jgi:hypothetical protein
MEKAQGMESFFGLFAGIILEDKEDQEGYEKAQQNVVWMTIL